MYDFRIHFKTFCLNNSLNDPRFNYTLKQTNENLLEMKTPLSLDT